MKILEAELIRKYFGSEHKGCPEGCDYVHADARATRVLTAMTEQIKIGELYLQYGAGEWKEMTLETTTQPLLVFHAYQLRLPDRWQKKECDHRKGDAWFGVIQECIDCHVLRNVDYPKPQPAPNIDHIDSKTWNDEFNKAHKPSDAVEEKIKEITHVWTPGSMEANDMSKQLRELVRLVREGK